MTHPSILFYNFTTASSQQPAATKHNNDPIGIIPIGDITVGMFQAIRIQRDIINITKAFLSNAFFMSSASDSCVISIGNDYGEVILLSKDKNAMADSV